MKIGNTTQKHPNPRLRLFFSVLACIIILTPFSLFAAPPQNSDPIYMDSEILTLNSTILAETTFQIIGPSTVDLTLGTPHTGQYTYESNAEIFLTIESGHNDGTIMRLKHESAEAFINYLMSFDYGDGILQPVDHGIPRLMQGFAINGSFEILAPEDEMALAGNYSDTITFSFETE